MVPRAGEFTNPGLCACSDKAMRRIGGDPAIPSL